MRDSSSALSKPTLSTRSSRSCANLGGGSRRINVLAEKSPLHFFAEELGSGAECAGRQLVLGKAHALGQDDSEAIEECGLGCVGLTDASQADLAVRRGR